MKKQISAILIAISMCIFMSCSTGNKESENQTSATDTSMKMQEQTEPTSHEANNEAKESHEVHKPGDGPHKGIIEEAGEKNHIEMTIKEKNVAFYPLDDLTNPVDINGWTGKAVFQYKDGSSKTIDLMMMDGALTAMDANSDKSFKAIATLMMNGTTISAQFSSEGSMGHHEEEGEHHHEKEEEHHHDDNKKK